MVSFRRQLSLLLWKNFTLRRREPVKLVIELIWPLFLFLILVLVKKQNKEKLDKNVPECHYDGKAMPSAGALPFLQSMVCTASNRCHQTTTPDEYPGNIDTWNSSLLSEVFVDIERFLSNQSDVGSLVDLLDDLRVLQELQNNPPQNCSISIRGLENVLVDPQKLADEIRAQNINLTPEQVQELLNSSINVGNLNISQFYYWLALFQQLPTSQDPSQLTSEVRSLICTEDGTSGILSLDNLNQTRELTAALCALNDSQLLQLLQDVQGDLDVTKLYGQFVECTGKSLKVLNDQRSLEELVEAQRAFFDMKSLQKAFTQLNQTFSEAMNDFNGDRNGRGLNVTKLMSQLFCGRNTSLMFEDTNARGNDSFVDGVMAGDDKSDEYIYENDTTPFCNDVFKSFQRSASTRILWRQLKPLVRGKIPYAPDTPATRRIIQQANFTFDTLSRLKVIAKDWLQISPNVSDYLENNEQVNEIRILLDELVDQPNVTSMIAHLLTKVALPPGITLPEGLGLPPGFTLPPGLALPPGLNLPSGWNLPENLNLPPGFELPPGFTLPTNLQSLFGNLTGLLGDVAFMDQLLVYQRWLSNEDLPNVTTWKDCMNYTDQMMITIMNYMDCFEFDKFEGFENEEKLVERSLTYIEEGRLWAGIVFDVDTTDPEKLPSFIPYRIRIDQDRVDTTAKYQVLDRFYSPGARDQPLPDMKYLTYGFAYVQDMVSHGIIRAQTNMTQDNEIGIVTQQFPYPCYVYSKFVIYIARMIPLFMVLSWIFSVAMIVKGIVYEKEQRLKEVMKTMGLSNSVHWLAWFITCLVMMLASTLLLLMTIVGGDVIEKSSSSVMFVFFLSFSIATISQCFMFSVFFSKANIAAACAAIFYFIGYLPYSFCVNWEDIMTTGQKVTACLASTTAFGFGCNYIARYEEVGVGLQWSNIAESPVIGDDFNMAKVILIMLGDAVIYWVITWYVEAVRPGEFGMPRPWYFIFTRSFWCCQAAMSDDIAPVEDAQMYGERRDHFEAEPNHLSVGVAIRGLKKIYKRGQRVAVDRLTLNFYEGQITSFLGHNGAGKTTTMSILTGLFPPTSGTAYIYNKDVRREIDAIRQDMGTCPQHNVLFHKLTVEEHLWFYAMLKGVDSSKVKAEMATMLKDVKLMNKKKDLSANLSGGMKRKLSIAIAFVGGSKVVILDEPTAGVDPHARRSIWDLLLKYRSDRTIILSTHFMDEADILGDRIAIISQGKLCCCGSSQFLKDRFGSGYYLTLVKKGDDDVAEGGKDKDGSAKNSIKKSDSGHNIDEGIADLSNGNSSGSEAASSTTDLPGSSQTSAVTSFIQAIIPDAVLMEDFGSELTYQLPDDRTHTAKYEHLFTQLDNNLDALRVSSYGISDCTLEEVFLKVAEETGVDSELNDERCRQQMEQLTDGGNLARPVTRLSFRKDKKFSIFGSKVKPTDQRELMNPDSISDAGSIFSDEDYESDTGDLGVPLELINQCNGAGTHRETGARLVARQFWSQLVKRFHHLTRSKKAFIVQILLPAVFICLAMLFAMLNPPSPEQPSLELQPWRMIPEKKRDVFNLYSFYSNDAPDSIWANRFEDLLLKRPGIGVRCMNPDVYSIADYPCGSEDLDTSGEWTTVAGNVNNTKACSCQTGYQECPADAAGPSPPHMVLPSTETMYNMTQRNISQWILRTHEDFIRQRYGGLSFGERNSLVLLNSTELEANIQRILAAANGGQDPGYDVAVETPQIITDMEYLVENLATKRNAKVWYNNKGWIAMVSYMNVMNNLVLRAHLPEGENPRDYGISVSNHPMNSTRKQLAQYTFTANIRDVLIAISVIFAMSNVPASFLMFLCEERASNSKHLQLVSGIHPVVYWTSNFTWDMLNYLISATLCILIMVAFQVQSYVSVDNAPGLVSLMLLYGWSVIPLMYPFSFVFTVPSTAFVTMSCLNIFVGIITTLSTFILESLQEQDLDDINAILMKVFLFFPHYCLGRGLIDMTRNQIVADTFKILGEDLFRSPFSWDILGRNLLAMTLLGPLFFALSIMIQYQFWYQRMPCCKTRNRQRMYDVPDEDRDVAKERRRIATGQTDSDIMVMEGLTKIYRKAKKRGRLRAVDNTTLGVHKGECFGLLGVNGAGKTTTFKMLTGDTSVTGGNVHLAGHSILTHMTQVHQNLGYCPQFDALCPLLTGREHLELYARLRGVPEKDIPLVAAWGIHKLGLTRYANKCAGDYSGGNKRKLSTAISLIGNPPVIFLDEPTTGMDPKARRFLWNCISDITKEGRSVILTSHSMEECEALCSRMAIMVNGTFKCLGSSQHLKNRFGDGYTLILRVSPRADLDAVSAFIRRTFRQSVLQERHHNMVQHQLGSADTSLAAIFGQLEAVREELGVEDYSVSQTTLDQVFINFAKQQTDLQADELAEESMATPYPDSPANLYGVGPPTPTPPPHQAQYTAVALNSPTPGAPDPTLQPEKPKWLTVSQFHSVQDPQFDSEDESVRGSQVDLLPGQRQPAVVTNLAIIDTNKNDSIC